MLDFALLGVGNQHICLVYAAILNFNRLSRGHGFARVRKHLARFGIEYILGKLAVRQSVRKVKLFIEFVSADLDNVVAARVKEQIIEVLADGSLRGNFAGAQPSVKLYQAVAFRFGRILCDSILYHFVVCEQIEQRPVRAEAERAQQYGGAYLAFSVNVYPQNAACVLL